MNPVDSFLASFNDVIDAAFGFLHGPVFSLFGTFVAIGFTLWLCFEISEHRLSWPDFARRIIWIAFWGMVINGQQQFPDIISSLFVELGMKASGGQLTAADFFSPGNIANLGIERSDVFFNEADRLAASGYMGSGSLQFFSEILTLWVVGWLTRVAFFLLSISVFAAQVVYKLISLAAFVALIFVGWDKTFWIAAGAIGGIFKAAIKLFALAVVVSVTLGVISTMPIPDIPTRAAIAEQVLTAIVIVGLAVFGGSSVAGAFSGAARGMGLGAAVAATVSTVGAVAAPAMAVGGAVRSAGAAAAILREGGNAAGRTLAGGAGGAAAIRAGVGAGGNMASGGSTGSTPGSTASRMAARRGGLMHAAHAAKLMAPDDDDGGNIQAPHSMGR